MKEFPKNDPDIQRACSAAAQHLNWVRGGAGNFTIMEEALEQAWPFITQYFEEQAKREDPERDAY